MIGGSVPCCDIVDGWKLYTVNNTVVFSLDAPALQCLLVKGGQVSLVFLSTGVGLFVPTLIAPLLLFLQSISQQVQFPFVIAQLALLCVLRMPCSQDRAGIGGFFATQLSQARMVSSVQISASDLPAWFRCAGGSGFQGCVAASRLLPSRVGHLACSGVRVSS